MELIMLRTVENLYYIVAVKMGCFDITECRYEDNGKP